MNKALVNRTRFLDAIDVQFYVLADASAAADFTVPDALEGPIGFAHGGALASLLDEAMGAAAWYAGARAAAAHIGFDYLRPVPLGAAVRITAQVERREGRKVYTSGVIALADGSIAVTATGLFVEAPAIFAEDAPVFRFVPTEDK